MSERDYVLGVGGFEKYQGSSVQVGGLAGGLLFLSSTGTKMVEKGGGGDIKGTLGKTGE